MSLYKKLPVYRKCYELTQYVEQCVAGFNKKYKYTIGSELRMLLYKLLRFMSKLNRQPAQHRAAYLQVADGMLDDVEIQMTLCLDLKVFKSQKSWYHAAEMLYDIRLQITKLENYFEGKKQSSGGSEPPEES